MDQYIPIPAFRKIWVRMYKCLLQNTVREIQKIHPRSKPYFPLLDDEEDLVFYVESPEDIELLFTYMNESMHEAGHCNIIPFMLDVGEHAILIVLDSVSSNIYQSNQSNQSNQWQMTVFDPNGFPLKSYLDTDTMQQFYHEWNIFKQNWGMSQLRLIPSHGFSGMQGYANNYDDKLMWDHGDGLCFLLCFYYLFNVYGLNVEPNELHRSWANLSPDNRERSFRRFWVDVYPTEMDGHFTRSQGQIHTFRSGEMGRFTI